MSNLLSSYRLALALPILDVVEELLHWIQPRRVLCVEQHVRLELPCSLVDLRHLVDRGVVHEHDDVLSLGARVYPQLVKDPVQEVVEHHCVGAALGDLRSQHALTGDRSDQ